MAKPKTATGFASLSTDNKEWMKKYEDLGWTFEYDETGWSADKAGLEDPDAYHSFDAFMVMMNRVEEYEMVNRGLEPVYETEKGRRLPGAHEYTNKELDLLTERRRQAVVDFKLAQKEISDVNEECLNAFAARPDYFTLEESTGAHVYRSAKGGGLRINHTTVDKVESIKEDE